MSHKSKAVALGIVAVVVLALSGLLGSGSRALVAVPLVLVLPGFALARLLFHSRMPGLLEMSIFSVGLSLLVIILGGLVVNWTPWGLGALPMCLSIFTVCVAGIASRQAHGNPFVIAARRRTLGTSKLLPLVIAGGAAIVLAITCGIATQSDARQSGTGFTQLWILQTTVHGAKSGRIGITNNEQFATVYTVRLSLAGRTLRTWQSIRLGADHSWQATIALPSSLRSNERVEVTLYRAEFPGSVYRRAWLR